MNNRYVWIQRQQFFFITLKLMSCLRMSKIMQKLVKFLAKSKVWYSYSIFMYIVHCFWKYTTLFHYSLLVYPLHDKFIVFLKLSQNNRVLLCRLSNKKKVCKIQTLKLIKYIISYQLGAESLNVLEEDSSKKIFSLKQI